jgi:hypothetical protein
MLEVPSAQALQEQAQEPTRRPTAQGEEYNSAREQTKMVLDSEVSKGEEDNAIRRSVDRPREQSVDDNAGFTSTVDLTRPGTSPKPSIGDESNQGRPSASDTGKEAPIAREHIRQSTAARARDITAFQSAEEDPAIATRRSSSSVKRMKTRRRSSAIGVEDNPPPRERLHQSHAQPYSTAKRNQSKQEELNHHNSKKNEVQPRQPRHKQIEGHLLRPERIWRYPERLYQDQRQQEKEGTDLLRQSHEIPSVQSRQFQHPTQGSVNPGPSQRKVHWQ